MNEQLYIPDPAAIFGCAVSLWAACKKVGAENPELDFSEIYNGTDELMRIIMRVANHFEEWACSNVEFERLSDVWPYMMEDRFGAACLALVSPTRLDSFDETDCLSIALTMHLPVRLPSEGDHTRAPSFAAPLNRI